MSAAFADARAPSWSNVVSRGCAGCCAKSALFSEVPTARVAHKPAGMLASHRAAIVVFYIIMDEMLNTNNF